MSHDAITKLLKAIHSQEPVQGLTHGYYRYPARFSPQFARAAIEVFSRPGDLILDPFMGGGTTMVEAATLGRPSIGADINPLAVFLARVKTRPLSDSDLRVVHAWVRSLCDEIRLHRPPVRPVASQQADYQRNLPWPMRKSIELALARLGELPQRRQQRFARCLLLRTGQWALDCRDVTPSASEFRDALMRFLGKFVDGMRQYRSLLRIHAGAGQAPRLPVLIRTSATELPQSRVLARLPKKPSLVVTSPPYPGVHILYHRWSIHGRKESGAPYWIADCTDGQGAAYYTFGDRRRRNLASYFEGIRQSFEGIRQVLSHDAIVIQLIAFSQPDWQIPAYLHSMNEAGFEQIAPQDLGIPAQSPLWRDVPGRRWFARIHEHLPSSRELVLFHRPA